MKRVILSFMIFSVVFLFAACSSDAPPPDGNAVQVGERDYENMPIAEIPTEFVSAADALAAGSRLFDAGETEKAIDVLLQAVKLDPDLAEAYFKLGVAYDLVESEDQSVDQVAETPTPGPRSKNPAEKKKNSVKAFESAASAYKKLIAKDKKDDVAHFYLGLTYNKLNEDEDA
ncbi:MAG: tetratricopeptide repeat protein, partial [Acidobacteria bacterium]|nr:tetratricopeptide repeat protein [Acidobacteriota bacterium]